MKRDSELYPFRRHLRTCSYFGRGGREIRLDKCNCPFHVDGLYNGERVRQSLKTNGYHVADKRVLELIRNLDAKLDARKHAAQAGESGPSVPVPVGRTVLDAIERFLATHGEIDQDGMFYGEQRTGNTGAALDSCRPTARSTGS